LSINGYNSNTKNSSTIFVSPTDANQTQNQRKVVEVLHVGGDIIFTAKQIPTSRLRIHTQTAKSGGIEGVGDIFHTRWMGDHNFFL
jgi:hypothetical protein